MRSQKGFIAPLVAIIVLIAITIGGYVYWQSAQLRYNNENPVPYSYGKKEVPHPTPSPKENGRGAALDAPFQLKIGEQISLPSEHLTITLLDITEDSRCPSGVQCVWAGRVSAKIRLAKDKENPEEITLTSRSGNTELATKNVSGYTLALQRVDPYPDKKPIEKSRYSATLFVTKLKNQAINTSDWKTYRNDKYGFEMKYPSDMAVRTTVPTDKSISDSFEIYDPSYVIPEDALGVEVRAEFKLIGVNVYPYSPDRLHAVEDKVKNDPEGYQWLDKRGSIPITNGTIYTYLLRSGLIGPYFQALAYNDKVILEFYTTHDDNQTPRILSTLKFTK